MSHGRCRMCEAELELPLVDLGVSPLANSYLQPEQLEGPETFYPLCPRVCQRCWLAQLPVFEAPEQIFGDYAYFSSYSDTWLEHVDRYAATICERFGLGGEQLVVELASNDGCLLQAFQRRGVRVHGVEPAANVAHVAEQRGVPTSVCFFSSTSASRLREQHGAADVIAANNVLAHVPDVHDFVAGAKLLLAPGGVVTMEFPHLLRLLEENQFDTIYHEHFSYFWLETARELFARHQLQLFDVEELPTHGGSLRVYLRHADDQSQPESRVAELIERERVYGSRRGDTYEAFWERVARTKRRLLAFLVETAERGETVVGYGAPAKGNTLLNYCGVGPELLAFTVDRSPAKQGRYLPGSRIPIHAPEELLRRKPEWVLILPWNIRHEIVDQMADIRKWGGKFVVAIPRLKVLG